MSSPAESSVLALNVNTSTAYPFVGCSTTLLLASPDRNTSAPSTTRFFDSTAGLPTCAYSTLGIGRCRNDVASGDGNDAAQSPAARAGSDAEPHLADGVCQSRG